MLLETSSKSNNQDAKSKVHTCKQPSSWAMIKPTGACKLSKFKCYTYTLVLHIFNAIHVFQPARFQCTHCENILPYMSCNEATFSCFINKQKLSPVRALSKANKTQNWFGH